ncbi:sensor histidine kinase [Isoptericola sp. NPDC057559]|uniref:sensor histidine kinase n=1 Tax=Isoptericola sp. NPDC057559 TaxID=3346168 RepID=UPI0036CC22B8
MSVVVVLAGSLPTRPTGEIVWIPGVVALTLTAAAVLLARHRLSGLVLTVVVGLVVLSVPLGLFNTGSVMAAAVATYTMSTHSPLIRGAVVAGLVSTTVLICAWIAGEVALQPALLVLLGGAIGNAVRTQRQHIAAITERADRAERTREALARQRVAEDRLATARDLHDVVAHQIAVINLHAGVASSALRNRPDAAESSLRIIRRASRTVLTEIGGLLATLRDPNSPDIGPAGLSQLDDVVRGYAGDGLEITVRTDGDRYALTDTTDLTALRVIQEALTNAHKHGAGRRAHILLEYEPRTLRVTVANPVSVEPDSDPKTEALGTGQGLMGMRERVESLRGTLTYGRDGTGTWLVVAELPREPDVENPNSREANQ